MKRILNFFQKDHNQPPIAAAPSEDTPVNRFRSQDKSDALAEEQRRKYLGVHADRVLGQKSPDKGNVAPRPKAPDAKLAQGAEIPAGQPGSAKSESQPMTMGRRAAIAGGISAILFGGDYAYNHRQEIAQRLSRKKSSPVAYQEKIGAAMQELTVKHAEEDKDATLVPTKLMPGTNVETLIVDGRRPDGEASTLALGAGVKDIYLNQIMLKDVTNLEIIRTGGYTEPSDGQQPLALKHYTLTLSDKEHKPLLNLEYGPVKTMLNSLDAGIGEAQDRFPNLHFFNSSGIVKDFNIPGTSLVADLPEASVARNTAIESATKDVKQLLDPYILERKLYEDAPDEHIDFETDFYPKPIIQTNPTLLANLAETFGAREAENKKIGR